MKHLQKYLFFLIFIIFVIIVIFSIIKYNIKINNVKGTTITTLPINNYNKQIDWNRYSGLWYEQIRVNSYFEPTELEFVTAFYSINKNNYKQIDILNQGFNTKTGEFIKAYGIGNITQKPNILNVSFTPSLAKIPLLNLLIFDQYIVLYVDENYKMAIVGSKNKNYIWLLTREKYYTKEQLNIFYSVAKNNNYSEFLLNNLHFTKQI